MAILINLNIILINVIFYYKIYFCLYDKCNLLNDLLYKIISSNL